MNGRFAALLGVAVLAAAGCAPIAPYRGPTPAPGWVGAFADEPSPHGRTDSLRAVIEPGSLDHATRRIGALRTAPGDSPAIILIYGDNRPGFRMEANSPAYEPIENFSFTDGGRFVRGLLWSPVFLVTALLPTLDGPRDLVTVFTKRPRGGGEQKVQAAMEAEHSVDAVLSLGDVVFDGRRGRLWEDYARTSASLRTRTLLFTAPGNHERPYDAASLAAWNAVVMRAPEPGELWYVLDLPEYDARFVFLDSNVLTDVHNNYEDAQEAELSNRQLAWADSVLTGGPRFRFIVLHHPLFSSGHYAGDWGGADTTRAVARRRTRLLAMCAQRGVTAVVAGHEHLYQRMFVSTPDGHGFWHITSGGGGSPLYSIDEKQRDAGLALSQPAGLRVLPASVRSVKTYHYCRLELPRVAGVVRAPTASAGAPRFDVYRVKTADRVELMDQIDIEHPPTP